MSNVTGNRISKQTDIPYFVCRGGIDKLHLDLYVMLAGISYRYIVYVYLKGMHEESNSLQGVYDCFGV